MTQIPHRQVGIQIAEAEVQTERQKGGKKKRVLILYAIMRNEMLSAALKNSRFKYYGRKFVMAKNTSLRVLVKGDCSEQ